jgi:CheY-like chemotaxis protein
MKETYVTLLKREVFLGSLFPVLHRRSSCAEPICLPGLAFVPEEVKSKKILVVDDNAIILKTLSLKLQRVGYQVVTASDGSAAIRAMREEKPDLLVLDVSFTPDVPHGGGVPWDGFLLMKWLNGMQSARNIPVVSLLATVTML